MSKLKHSAPGFLRYMQMSNCQVFAFVEGKTDPYFYGKICECVCNPSRISYEVYTAQELPGAAGGKQALLIWFEYLRRRRSLIDNFKGKNTGAVFFVDKDVDDLMRIKKRSTHLVYTEYYDTENYIFKYGDVLEAMAAAACVDRVWLETQIVSPSIWKRNLAERWKQWLTLCLFARVKKVRANVNYGSTSQVNAPLNAVVDAAEYARRLADLQVRSGLTNNQFSRAFKRVSKLVDSFYANDEYDRIFKGKWYSALFDADMRSIAMAKPINSNGLSTRLVQALSMTLDFEQRWAAYLRESVRATIKAL